MDEPIPQLAPGVAPNTVTDARELLRERGYVAEFELVDDHLVSSRGDASCRVRKPRSSMCSASRVRAIRVTR